MYAVVLITVPKLKEAEQMAEALVKDKLAACVNIFDNMNAI